MNFTLLCSSDLNLKPMTFLYKLDLHPLKVYSQIKNQLSISSLSKVIILQTDRHIYKQMPSTLRMVIINFARHIHT